MSGRTSSSRVPKELRPVVGGIVLVAGVRTIDALWRLVTRRPTPIDAGVQGDGAAADGAGRVGDRLVYAALLGAALRVARRAGLPKEQKHVPDQQER